MSRTMDILVLFGFGFKAGFGAPSPLLQWTFIIMALFSVYQQLKLSNLSNSFRTKKEQCYASLFLLSPRFIFPLNRAAIPSFLRLHVYILSLPSLSSFIIERTFAFLDLFSPAYTLWLLVAVSFRDLIVEGKKLVTSKTEIKCASLLLGYTEIMVMNRAFSPKPY